MPKKTPWKIIAVALVAIVALGALVALRPWEGRPGEEVPGEEHVWVQYTASFKLLGTEDNEGLNILVIFPYPSIIPTTEQIENATEFNERGTVDLSVAPIEENFLIAFSPGRSGTSPRFENVIRKTYNSMASKLGYPILNIFVSELGVEDEFRAIAWLKIRKTETDKLTLATPPFPNFTRSTIHRYPGDNRNLEISVALSIEKQIDGELHPLETWQTRENITSRAEIVEIIMIKI